MGLSLYWILPSCGSSDEKKPVHAEEEVQQVVALSGKQLSLRYCQSCHLYPEPSLLDKHTWQRSVLPLMGRLFGIYEDNIPRSEIMAGAIDKNLVKQQHIFPEKQLISNETWRKITHYYISSAPDSLAFTKHNDIVFAPLEGFEIIVPPHRTATPSTTLVKIGPGTSHMYVGESKGKAGSLTVLNKDFEIIDTIKLPTPPVDVTIKDDGLALTLAGTLTLSPSNNPFGQLLYIFRNPGDDKYSFFRNFLDDLKRPLQTVFEDINGDGREDILIAEFGYYTGSLNLYEYRGGNREAYKKTILKNVPGAIRMYVKDMNSDGHKDIIALFAQGDEGISIFYNDGHGGFREKRILRFSPSYGSVYFELADVNNDGFFDILYCNGDNGDYPPVLKDYHGIRIFENDGYNNFEQVYFFPMYGAYKCSAADFDMDGDLDIVAISYFPDLQAGQRQDFVYLKNLGNYSFSPQSLQSDIPARWVTFDIGDLDGNGYKDIVLGAFGRYKDTTRQHQRVQQEGTSLLFLKNLGK